MVVHSFNPQNLGDRGNRISEFKASKFKASREGVVLGYLREIRRLMEVAMIKIGCICMKLSMKKVFK